MKKQIDDLKATRLLLEKVTNSLTLDELNTTPEGFSNNIGWNLAHIAITQQLLVYSLSGVEPKVSANYIDLFRKGTAPNQDITEEQLKNIKELLASAPDQTLEDYQNGLFKTFKEYPTSYGITLKSVEDAIEFNNLHEALHLGYIMSMKHAL